MARDAGRHGALSDGFHAAVTGKRGQDGRTEVVGLDREVVVIWEDTLPRADAVERAEAKGGCGDAVLEEAARVTPEGAPQMLMGMAPQQAAPQANLSVVLERTLIGHQLRMSRSAANTSWYPGRGPSGHRVAARSGWAR